MPQTTLLYAAAALMDMSVAGVMFAIGRRAAELGATPFELGVLNAALFAGTVFALVSGRLSDRYGRRTLAALGALVAALMSLACALTTRVTTLVIVCAVLGLGISSFWPSVIAWLGDGVSGNTLTQRMARFSMAWNLGVLVGFALTGFIFERGPQWAFFFATGAMSGVVALVLAPAKPATHRLAASTTPDCTPPVHIPAGRGFRKTGWLANFAVTAASSGVVAVFPVLATQLHIRADAHGALLALGRAAALVAFWQLQHLRFWRTRLWPLWVAQAVGAGALMIFGLADQFWMFAVAMLIAGSVSGYTYQASAVFTLEEMTEKGKGSGRHEAVAGTGMALGPLLAGLVGRHSSLRTPYFFCGLVLVWLIVVQMLVVYRRRMGKLAA